MPISLKNFSLQWLARLLKYSLYFIFGLVLVVGLVLVFLPTIVSTDWCNRAVQKTASNAIGREVAIGNLEWSWSRGIQITHLSVPDQPAFSGQPLAAIDAFALKPDIKSLVKQKIQLELQVSGLDVRIVKNSDGVFNLETLGAAGPQTTEKEMTEKAATDVPAEGSSEQKSPAPETPPKKTSPLSLPAVIRDITTSIRFDKIHVVYEDQAKNERYEIENLVLFLDVPSLKTAPLHLDLGLNVNLDVNGSQIRLPRSTLSLALQQIFDENGILTLDRMAGRLFADLPGIAAELNADMATSLAKGSIQLQLETVMAVAAPFLPKSLSPDDIDGNIDFQMQAGTDPDQPLAFDASLSAAGLALSGLLVGGKTIGPGNFGILLKGTANLPEETLAIENLTLDLLENSTLQATGQVEDLMQDNRKINFAISPLHLDVDEIVNFAGAFVPDTLVLPRDSDENALISASLLKFDGYLPVGAAEAQVRDLTIQLPTVTLTNAADASPLVRVKGGRLMLHELTTGLQDLFPVRAVLELGLAVDNLISGHSTSAITLSGIRLDSLNVNLENFRLSEKSDFGITGDLSLSDELKIDAVTLPKLARIKTISQSLNTAAVLSPGGGIQAALDHLDAGAGRVTLLVPGMGEMETGVDIHLAAGDFILNQLSPLSVDISDFIARVQAGNAVDISLIASAKDTGNVSFGADLAVSADLGALFEKLPRNLRVGISGTGDLALALSAKGRRPDETTIKALKNKKISGNLGFVNTLNLELLLNNSEFEIPAADAPPVTLAGLDGAPLLQYRLDGNTGIGELACNIHVNAITGIPGLAAASPLTADFFISASHRDASTLSLSQSFTMEPAGVQESITATLDHLDTLISASPLPPVTDWLRVLAADVSATITVPECNLLKQAGLPGLEAIDVSGFAGCDISFQNQPDQAVSGRVAITTKNMNIALPDIATIETLFTNIDLSKTYLIGTSARPGQVFETPGLSQDILSISSAQTGELWSGEIQSGAIRSGEIQSGDTLQHIRYLHERMNPAPALSFDTADIMAAPFPLIMGPSMLLLRLADGLPRMDYFQLDLLGGTINGSIALTRSAQMVGANTALTFSGINFSQVFPRAFAGQDRASADISGALYADFPITHELRPLLENARITLNFTRIGARALERLLYALDPYESNEAIMTQRQFLKTGSPKNIRIDIRDGFLSFSGMVSIKGMDISLPQIRRLNIASVPGLNQFEPYLAGLAQVSDLLQKAGARRIVFMKTDDNTTTLSFKSP
jgi:hypothetical protein